MKKILILIASLILTAAVICSSAHIEVEAAAAVSSPEPTATPDPYAGYFTDEEQVYISPLNDAFLYTSSDLYVQVTRHDNSVPQRWWVAEVVVRGDQTLKDGYPNGEYARKALTIRECVYVIARRYKAVLAVNGDFYVDTDNNPLGIIIRGGKVIYNNKQADSLALLPSGRLLPVKKGKITAKELLNLGCDTCWSFGPILVQLGKMAPKLNRHRLATRNPRCGIGMIEPNHYIIVAAEGRRPGVSNGFSLTEFAQIFLDYGCYTAYNMDGGISVGMAFLGQPLVYHPIATGGIMHPDGRRVPDIIYVGTSDLCAKEDDKVIRYSKLS